jgi:periplasmic copper chaperone A
MRISWRRTAHSPQREKERCHAQRRSLAGAAIGLSIWLVAPSGGQAADFTVGSLKITAPWSRATPAGSKTGAGYMVIWNEGSQADRLISAETPAARGVEMRTTSMKDGVMTMHQVSGGIAIPPGKDVTLAPGGQHMMFTLRFEKAGQVDVEFDAGGGRRRAGSRSWFRPKM